jgi:hypothetical protein
MYIRTFFYSNLIVHQLDKIKDLIIILFLSLSSSTFTVHATYGHHARSLKVCNTLYKHFHQLYNILYTNHHSKMTFSWKEHFMSLRRGYSTGLQQGVVL